MIRLQNRQSVPPSRSLPMSMSLNDHLCNIRQSPFLLMSRSHFNHIDVRGDNRQTPESPTTTGKERDIPGKTRFGSSEARSLCPLKQKSHASNRLVRLKTEECRALPVSCRHCNRSGWIQIESKSVDSRTNIFDRCIINPTPIY